MGLSNKFDSNIYIEPDGSRWVRVFHHNNPATYGIFVSHTNAEWNAGIYATENKWYDLGILNDITAPYELLVKQKTTSGATETAYRWTQSPNPLTTTDWNQVKPGTVTFNTNSPYSSSSMGGLYTLNGGNHMCLANNTNGNWYGIGCSVLYQGGFPGYPNAAVTTGYLDLYVRVDSLLEPLPEKGLRIWLPLTGDLINRGLEQGIEINNTGVTFDSAGKCGQCASFNGSTSRLSLTNLSVGNEWSYGCWVYTNQTSRAWEAIAVLNNNGGDADNQLGLYIYTTQNRFQSTANGQYNSSISFTTNKWSHLFATFDGTTLITYVDGVKVNEKAITNGLLARPNLTIGARSGSTSGGQVGANTFFLGKINDFRLYNYALSAKEVREISKALVLHYKLDGLTGGNENLILSSQFVSGGGASSGNTRSYAPDGSLKVVAASGNGNWVSLSFPQDSNSNIGSKMAVGDAYTISVDVKVEEGTTLPTLFINGGNGYKRLLGTIVLNQWIRAYYSSTWADPGTSYGNISLHLGFSGLVGTYYFKNFKLEKGSTPTAWSPSPLDAGYRTAYFNTIFDSSGFGYNGSLMDGRTINITSDTPRYAYSTTFPRFGDGGQCLDMTNTVLLPTITSGTVVWWVKYTSTQNLLLTGNNDIHYYLAASQNNAYYNSRITVSKWYVDGLPVSSAPKPATGAWHMYAVTGVNFTGWNTFRINRYDGSNAWSLNGSLSDFRIYNSTLSDADILELYQTSASIDKNGNYYTRELVE